jgi:Uma2 family endonuclease
MDSAGRAGKVWSADEFLRTDQHEFGGAWRYELVDGDIVAHDASTPDHASIVASIGAALTTRLRGNPDKCRPQSGSGAAPRRIQHNTARIPDVMIRCGDLPRVVFEVVSLSELSQWRARDRKRRDLQDVEAVEEIVEVYQDEMAAHVYRREAGGTWSFEAVGPGEAVVRLRSMGFEMLLAEFYEFAMP